MEKNEAIFAAGCFWGVEHLFKTVNGVIKTEVGYTGGITSPTYEEVCSGETGHKEAIKILYDPSKVTYEDLVKFFFEIHDFTQTNGQGPDLGEQYLSMIFYMDDEQKRIAEKLIGELSKKGYNVATVLEKSSKFWPAEDYHQNYYSKTGKEPYCHIWRKIF
jgi:peptide methionine sulfoxide reductase msrA/msrB